jgi:multidrug efflux pump subunit AcrA (membrane-fusion protein)
VTPGRRRLRTGTLAVAAVAFVLGAGVARLGGRLRPAAPESQPAHRAEHPSRESATPQAAGTVYVSPERQQWIGVRTGAVARRTLQTTIRSVGVLAFDETRVAQLHTKIVGWVERTFVDYVGRRVARGEPLLSVYSPELVATQNEYLLALRAERIPDGDAVSDFGGTWSLEDVARERLRLWDISDAQIEALRRSGTVQKTLTLYAPFDGIVLERGAFPGQYLTPEVTAYRIADLSTVWVLGEIFEYEQSRVKVGQSVEIEFPYGPATQRLSGLITYVSPTVVPETRRVQVRAEFANPGLELKPGSYVTFVIRTPPEDRVAVPKEALIDTGAKRYVILARPNGFFEPREVQVGEPSDDAYPVLAGVAEGERVVVSAQFLIDSETNLQAAMKAMSMSMPGMDMSRGGGKTNMEGMKMPPDPPKDAPHAH